MTIDLERNPPIVGEALYSDGQEQHIVLAGDSRSICGEFSLTELLPPDMDQSKCIACFKRERWRPVSDHGNGRALS